MSFAARVCVGAECFIAATGRRAILFALLHIACFGADQISLAWDDNSDDEIGFKVERAASGGNFAQIAIVGANVFTYVDTAVTREVTYSYRVCAFNQAGDSAYTNVVKAELTSRLTNISVRSAAVSASNPLTVGFVIGGASTKSILVRGIGPTLGTFGVTDALDDPILSLYSGTSLVDANDDWVTAANSAKIAATSLSVGAFPLPEAGRDAALLSVLKSGANSAELSGKEDSIGVALIELYDADANHSVRLVNVSARTEIRAGANAETVGFVIAGNVPKQILIRAIGPTLEHFGVTGALPDPQLALYRQGAASPLRQNDNWGGTDELKAAFQSMAAFALEDSSRDAALLVTLEAGAYTVEVIGMNRGSGSALIEIYEVP